MWVGGSLHTHPPTPVRAGSHLAHLHFQVTIPESGSTNPQLPSIRNAPSHPQQLFACRPLCYWAVKAVVRFRNRGRLVLLALSHSALKWESLTSEVFLTWCQQPHCRSASHLRIQSHPFREREKQCNQDEGYSCCKPIPRFSGYLIQAGGDGALPLSGLSA